MVHRLTKSKNLIYLIFLIYTPFILKYFNSIGLMDDYLFKYGSEIFKYNLDYLKFQISRGGFQILLPLQIWLQGLPFIVLSDTYYYLFNLLIVVGILRYGAFVVNKYIKINYVVFYTLFFTFPYFFDYIVHPSLQEKYIFLLFFVLLHLFTLPINKKNLFLIFFISLITPLIKLQAAPLWIIVFFLAFENKFKKTFIYSVVGFSISNIVVLCILIFNSGYFSSKIKQGFDFTVWTNNLFSTVHLLVFFVSFIALILFTKFYKNYFVISVILYQLVLVLLLSITTPSNNYLGGIYAFTLSIIVSSLFNLRFFKSFEKISVIALLIICILSNVIFFLPRAERWFDLDRTINGLRVERLENLYYSCEEGTNVLNMLQANKVQLLSDTENLKDREILFISDSYSCSNVESFLIKFCEEKTKNLNDYSVYKRMQLIQYQC